MYIWTLTSSKGHVFLTYNLLHVIFQQKQDKDISRREPCHMSCHASPILMTTDAVLEY